MGITFKTKWKAIEVKCKNCGNPFLKRDRAHRGTSRGRLRPSNVLTCSHPCSVALSYKSKLTYHRRKLIR